MFRLFGIQLSVHWTFFLLLGYVAWAGWSDAVASHAGLPVLGALMYGVGLVVFFGCVVLHELGHALTARRFGVGVPRILLLPIGGMAEFDSIPRKPSSEFLIALAGPAVNFVIVAVLLGCGVVFPGAQIGEFIRFVFSAKTGGVEVDMNFWQDLLAMNLMMGCFNLVPVFPMDGGRVLRALLAMRLEYVRATLIAATLAKVLAAGAVMAALYYGKYQPAVLFAFIFFAGEMEFRAVVRCEWEMKRWQQMHTELLRQTVIVEPPPLPDVTGRP